MSNSHAQEMIGAILEKAIAPLIEKLSKEARQPIELSLVALVGTCLITREISLGSAISGGANARGEVRVLVRSEELPARFLAESIFQNLAPESGYSGFLLRGKVELDGSRLTAKVTGQSNRYNVWGWGKEFRFPDTAENTPAQD